MEFAFVLTVLFTVMFGIMEFSRAAYVYHFIANAAREGTRYAMVRGSACTTWTSACPATTSNISSYVQELVPSGIMTATCNGNNNNPGCLVITTTYPGTTGTPASCNTTNGTNSPGCPVQVQVQYTYGFSLPFLKQSQIAMSSTSQMIISQ